MAARGQNKKIRGFDGYATQSSIDWKENNDRNGMEVVKIADLRIKTFESHGSGIGGSGIHLSLHGVTISLTSYPNIRITR